MSIHPGRPGIEVLSNILSGIGLLQMVLVCAVVVLAAVLRAFTGFGFGLAAVPVFALLMAPSEAVVLSTSLTLAVSLLTLKTYWGKFPLRPLVPMLAMALVGTVVGAAVLSAISPREFRLWIGISVIVACLVLTWYRPGQRRPGAALGGLTGLCSGLLNGAFAIPGPPVIIYAIATETKPVRSRALLMTYFLFTAVMALVVYATAGFITPASPWLFMLAFPAMYVGDKLGHWLFHRYGSSQYRRAALILLLVLGVVITVEALW